jgi:Tfp pilus assembly protein PilE
VSKVTKRIGVTLVELLVVFAILAILFALSMPALRSVWQANAETDTRNEMQQIVVAYCDYKTANENGPKTPKELSPFYENSSRINEDLDKGVINVIWGIPAKLLGSYTLVAYETSADRIGNRLVAMGDGSVHTLDEHELQVRPQWEIVPIPS